MLKIAVYSEEKVMSPLLQEYMGIWQRDAGCVCAVRYYDNVHAIMVDMDLEGIYDVVVVYRSWDVADVLKKDSASARALPVYADRGCGYRAQG